MVHSSLGAGLFVGVLLLGLFLSGGQGAVLEPLVRDVSNSLTEAKEGGGGLKALPSGPDAPLVPSVNGSLDGNSTGNVSVAGVEAQPDEDEEYYPGGPYTFTVTSSEVGFTWDQLPFLEKYKWAETKIPCHHFKLQVPDERTTYSHVNLCIYRPHLEYTDDSDRFIRHDPEELDTNKEKLEQRVYGYVKGQKRSAVYGRVVGNAFYGEVEVYDEDIKADVVYVVEDIKLLKNLMRNNEKILRNIFAVMSKAGSTPYNAVVTKGASLMNFMASVNPSEFVHGSFLVFSTNRNSYITAGEPEMEVDDDGKITFNAGGDKLVIENEGHSSIHLLTGDDREYVFRPGGKTTLQDGISVETLEEHEGSVAISAFTAESSYGCILPTPAFDKKRKGGYVCKVCLAVDRVFLKEYMEKITPPERIALYLGRMVDKVSWIFRSTDWNEDGKPDNIGLTYDNHHVTWDYVDSGKEALTQEELDVLYGDLARVDFTECCVVLAYTMKRLPGSILGKGAVGPDKRLNPRNGICGGQDPAGLSNNVVLISANSKRGSYLPMTEDQLTYLTAQQLGRAFGSPPDGVTGDESCDEFKDKKGIERHFLMWPDVLRNNVTVAEKVMSKCSRQSIAKVLDQCKSSCFDLDKHPFCGNGIVEEGEECDCGGEEVCSKQTCCYSRAGLHPCRKSGIGCKPSSAPSMHRLLPMLPMSLIGLLLATGLIF